MSAIDELKTVPLLQDLGEQELRVLADRCVRRKITRGTYLIHEEDEGQQLMFITDGRVNVTLTSNDGKEVVVSQLRQGDFFGEISVLTGAARSASVVAVSDVVVYVLSRQNFDTHILGNNGLALALLRALAGRLAESTSKIGDLMLLDVYRRVARTLRKLATRKVHDGKSFYVVENRPTHQELASMIGTSREMVTRALKGLEEDECIKIEGKSIQVLAVPL